MQTKSKIILVFGPTSSGKSKFAIKLAKKLGPGKTIVTILCDYGDRYKSKLYNPVFLENMGLPAPDWPVN